MHARLLALAVLAATLALAAPAAAQTRGPEGEHLYGRYCARCHGSNGAGGPRVGPEAGTTGGGPIVDAGPSLRGVGARAADFYLRTGYMPLDTPDEQPRRRDPLPFDEAEIDALVAYVASLGPGPPVPEPHPERGDVAQGLQLFTEHCAGCHQVVAEGGYVTGARVPPLEAATPTQIAEAVRIGPYVMPTFSEKAISDDELDSIIAYVQQAKHPQDDGGWAIGHLGPVPEGLVTWWIAAVALVAVCIAIGKRLRS